jgi:ribosomal protein S18 acetylase RimI-like enzyme
VFVAELSGEIVGSVQFYPDASTEGLGLPSEGAGFRKLAVRPQARGRSIGRMLVEACFERAFTNRAAAIGIHTASFMEAARRLYASMGFRRCPQYDLQASQILGLESGATDIAAIAYRLDLPR